MPGGAASETSRSLTPSEGRKVNDAGPAITSSRPVLAFTSATILSRIELRRRSDDQERRARRHERQKGKRRVEDNGAPLEDRAPPGCPCAHDEWGPVAPPRSLRRRQASPSIVPRRGASGASRRMGRRVSRHGAVSSRAWRHLSHRSGRKPKRRRCHLRPIRRNGRPRTTLGPRPVANVLQLCVAAKPRHANRVQIQLVREYATSTVCRLGMAGVLAGAYGCRRPSGGILRVSDTSARRPTARVRSRSPGAVTPPTATPSSSAACACAWKASTHRKPDRPAADASCPAGPAGRLREALDGSSPGSTSAARARDDAYGRLLASRTAAGRELNAEMVRNGLPQRSVRYSQRYAALEAEARSRLIGIWRGSAEPPWSFRARR